MTYTLYSDASYTTDSYVGAYAFVATLGEFVHKQSGILKSDVADNLLAELLAFSEGISFINKIIPKSARSLVTIEYYTDCEWVLRVLSGESNGGKHKNIVKSVLHATAGYKLSGAFVRAHQEKMDQHMVLNSWCDHAARAELRRGGWL